MFPWWSAAVSGAMILLFTGGLKKWQHHNSQSPSEPVRCRSIDQIVSPALPDYLIDRRKISWHTHKLLLFEHTHSEVVRLYSNVHLCIYTLVNNSRSLVLIMIILNIVCWHTHAHRSWCKHACKANFGHTDSAVTAGTDSSPAQLLTVAQIGYDISSSLIFLLIHSGSARPFKLFPQSQEKPQQAISCVTGLQNENSFFWV